MAAAQTITEDDNLKQDDIVIVETPIKADDERTTRNADDTEGSDHPDDQPSNDPEREAIRERRRLEKIERKKRREEAMGRDKLEREFLLKRNDELERRLSSVELQNQRQALGQVDKQIASLKNEAVMAERVIAKAVEAGNGDDVAKAMRYRDEAKQKAAQLEWQKRQHLAQQAQAQPQQQQPGMDPSVARHAQDFLAENKWYDPQGRDEDSAVVLAIDGALAREGFDPRTEDYWDELRDRAARRLPEKFGKEAPAREERTTRGGPAVGSGREHAPSSTRKEVYISPERKQALVEAGVWDDPILRQKYVKRYAEYDRSNRA